MSYHIVYQIVVGKGFMQAEKFIIVSDYKQQDPDKTWYNKSRKENIG